MTPASPDIPLVAHVIHRFGVGGLENGIVTLINHMPEDRYRHAIVCLQGYTDFRQRLRKDNVHIHDVAKRDGHDLGVYLRLYRLLRELRPAIVHTRNLSAMEVQVVAAMAGVPGRVHGEHGRDMSDLYGKSRKYNLLRKLVRPFVGHYVAVSRDLQDWLTGTVGVEAERISQIHNGVDNFRFHPPHHARKPPGPPGFIDDDSIVIGSVGRMVPVKDYPNLVRAFQLLLQQDPSLRDTLRLLIVGDGETRAACLRMLEEQGDSALAWLPGERADIPDLMAAMDIFVLPSLGEGLSNTILEAMATGLPVIATEVGGNPELVQPGTTGQLIAPASPSALAQALLHYVRNAELRRTHGHVARVLVDREFSIYAMVQNYLAVYDRVLERRG